MDLTEEVKKRIDNMSYESLLSKWRFALMSDPLFQGDSAIYFKEVMHRKKEEVGITEYIMIWQKPAS